MAETLNTRVTRIEKNLAETTRNLAKTSKTLTEIAKKQSDMDALVKTLLDAQIKTENRFQRTDERIEKLVSAIGELISLQKQNGKKGGI